MLFVFIGSAAIETAEAAQIVLDVPVQKTMVPLNVTHTAIVTREIQRKILSPDSAEDEETTPLPPAASPLRHMLSTLVSFFAARYRAVFGFLRGPPIHDALTIAYVAHPGMFAWRRFRVDVELNGQHTVGETVVDVWDYRKSDDTWGKTGKNCYVTDSINVRLSYSILSSPYTIYSRWTTSSVWF